MSAPVVKKVLPNGLTIVVSPSKKIPKVSMQMWYGVGSKDEKNGEKGLAHLLEHMIFKGTKTMSESDINLITNKLSGYTNAFTSYDYTGYLFDLPSQHWLPGLEMFADCMTNCTFKEDLLNSELKAVIQELKMYRDNYPSTLVEEMVSTIFPDHPYHNPIIGYKQDLWGITHEGLMAFYKKHYVPNNATLVMVGDVSPEEVFAEAERLFGTIPAKEGYKREEYYHNRDMLTHNLVLSRDVNQPFGVAAFAVPGAHTKVDYFMDVLAWIIASGRGSRLYKALVDEQNLVTEVDAFPYDLQDHGLFFIQFQPRDGITPEQVYTAIRAEFARLIRDGFTDEELERAARKAEADHLATMETNQKIAYALGKAMLVTGDENFVHEYVEEDRAVLRERLTDIIKNYLKPSLMHTGQILPIDDEQREDWRKLQEESDALDGAILNRKGRETDLEPGVVVETIEPKQPKTFDYPKYQEFTLSNGLEVLAYQNDAIPKIDCVLELKAKHHFDPVGKEGIGNFVADMLMKGTKNRTAQELTDAIESRGMSLSASPGYMSMDMLSRDMHEGLEILTDVLANARFDKADVEQVRDKILSEITYYWDTPTSFAGQLLNQEVYPEHPYSKNLLGSKEVLQSFDRDELYDYYKKAVTPDKARLAIVGDFTGIDLQKELEATLGKWQGPPAMDVDFSALSQVKEHDIEYPINRDQVVLSFGGLSIPRSHPDYDKLLLFEQIFSGGVLGAMSSRLFKLREQSGLFYTISGSLIARADEQPGMAYVRTIVSLDRLKEAEEQIKHTINTAVEHIEDEEFSQAQNALINAMVDNFETNQRIASTFLLLKRHGLPLDYFDTRPAQLLGVDKSELHDAVKKVLDTDKMVTVRVGRL